MQCIIFIHLKYYIFLFQKVFEIFHITLLKMKATEKCVKLNSLLWDKKNKNK